MEVSLEKTAGLQDVNHKASAYFDKLVTAYGLPYILPYILQ